MNFFFSMIAKWFRNDLDRLMNEIYTSCFFTKVKPSPLLRNLLQSHNYTGTFERADDSFEFLKILFRHLFTI